MKADYSTPISGQPQSVPAAASSQTMPSQGEPDFEIYSNDRLPIQLKLTVGAPNDPMEHEADAMADKVMRMPEPSFIQRKAACSCNDYDDEHVHLKPLASQVTPFMQTKADGPATVSDSVSGRIKSSMGGGTAMDKGTRSFMESRFGTDFSGVRIHNGDEPAQLNRSLNARAFTVSNNIYFNSGQYQPGTDTGKHLLAHELTHVVQQGSPNKDIRKKSITPRIQRAPTISVVDQNFIGPLAANQRRANISCPIFCNRVSMGTLNAVGLFYHQDRVGTRSAPTATDNGVGTALHFQSNGPQNLCKCDSFKIIQVIRTTHPAAGRDGAGYVDNNNVHTPFYGDVYLSGNGEHQIPQHYPDAGETISTTHSIYDRPARPTAGINTTIDWRAEACVACVRNTGPDIILGGATYGFTIPYDATTHTFGTIQGIGPSCLGAATLNFESTLRNDPTTSSYNFKVDRDLVTGEKPPIGDFENNPATQHMA